MNSSPFTKKSGRRYNTNFGWDRLTAEERLEKLLKRNQYGGKKKKHKTPRQLLNIARNQLRAQQKSATADSAIQGWRVWVKTLDGRKSYIEYYISNMRFCVSETLFRNFCDAAEIKYYIC